MAPLSARKGKLDKLPAELLRQLRDCVGFLALHYVFEKKITRKADQFKEKQRKFWGDDVIRGSLVKLINGEEAYADIYETIDTDLGSDIVLKNHCHSLAGIYVTRDLRYDVDLLSRQAFTLPEKGKIGGRSLTLSAETVLKSCKKTVSMVRKLKGKLVHLNEREEIVSYASGQNETEFLRHINDIMFMSLMGDKLNNPERGLSALEASTISGEGWRCLLMFLGERWRMVLVLV